MYCIFLFNYNGPMIIIIIIIGSTLGTINSLLFPNARTPLNKLPELFGAPWVNKLHLHFTCTTVKTVKHPMI